MTPYPLCSLRSVVPILICLDMFYCAAAAAAARMEANANPANWMLEVSNPGAEKMLGVDFAQIWQDSTMARCGLSGV